MKNVVEHLRTEKPEKRQEFIVDCFESCFGENMETAPEAWRGKFRKMAATPFAFYRGSAILFYADVVRDDDPFQNEKTSRVWIQGDLHAENFGTYMNGAGKLVFDVNDFDEAYVAPFTWDLKRLVASLALIGYEKAMSDGEIRQMIAAIVEGYLDQVAQFASGRTTPDFALTLDNTKGKLNELLQEARLQTRIGLLNRFTSIENYDRRVTISKYNKPLSKTRREKVEAAFQRYLETIPAGKRFGAKHYQIKDVTATAGMGIGSAGLSMYTLLLEGPTQALENDVMISMKQAQIASPSRVINNPEIERQFEHNGHRTVLSQRALQAYADPWLGYTTLDGVGQFVAEVSPYTYELEWGNLNELKDILETLDYMGRAVAKIHCVSDVDSDHTVVPFSTDKAIQDALQGQETAFVEMMTSFGEGYGAVVRDDHRLFVDAFRNHKFKALQ